MGLSFQPLLAQESILKEFAESNNDRKFCFYPSTLRMINLSQDQGYFELIEPIEKLLFYRLDSSSSASRSYRSIMNQYIENGYEEYAQVFGGDYDIYILGKERKVQEWVGVIKQGSDAYAFYLTGQVNWQKIPKLTETIQQNDMLNLFDMLPENKKRKGD